MGISGELKEERPDHSGSWRIVTVHTAMSLVEQGVVVWQERVTDGKDLLADGSNRWPAVGFLHSVIKSLIITRTKTIIIL